MRNSAFEQVSAAARAEAEETVGAARAEQSAAATRRPHRRARAGAWWMRSPVAPGPCCPVHGRKRTWSMDVRCLLSTEEARRQQTEPTGAGVRWSECH